MAYLFDPEEYEIIKLIGEGSFGKTYLAKDIHTQENVVIKVVENEDIWKCIKENEHLLCNIDNENIVKIYRLEIIEDKKCIIQEYVQGENLNTFISNNDLLLEDFLNISYGVFNAIGAMSKLELSHKDIKPSNIVYDKNQKIAKIIDLDYIYMILTHTNHYIGTLKYSSPEQIIDNEASNKADVYSFGLVMCFMINGDISFNTNLKRFAWQAKEDAKRSLKKITDLNDDISNKIVNLISKTLKFDPEERITALEAQQYIKDIKKICNIGSNKNIVIHEYMGGYNHIANDSTYLETSAMFLNTITLSSRSVRIIENNIVNQFDHLTEDIKRKENENIYRQQLLKEYNNILLQAKISFGLWVFSFVICFIIISIAIYSILNGNYIEGIVTIILDGAIGAIQKLFSIREDHYRKLMEQKIKHLETGDYLDYAFEKVEKLNSSVDKNKETLKLIKTIREHAKKDINNTN